MTRILNWVAALLAASMIAGCSSNGNPPGAPANVVVIPADSSAVASWTMESGIEYWVWTAQGTTITPQTCPTIPGCTIHRNATSPYIVLGLTNGTQYSLIVTGTQSGSAAGASSPVATFVPNPAGSSWTAGTPFPNTMYGVGYTAAAGVASAYFIAVGAQGALYASADSKTWTALKSNVVNNLNAVLYADSKFVVVGDQGLLLTSTDAVTWTPVSFGIPDNLYALAVAGAVIVTVGTSGTILVSSNATDWTPGTSGTSVDLHGVAYGNGTFVAVGDGGTILTSPNGLAWTARTSSTTANLRAITYAASLFVAVGANGTVLTSADGVTWTARTQLNAASLNAIVYGTRFVTVGSGGAVFVSTDGISWTAATSGTTSDLNGVAFSAGIVNTVVGVGYVAVGADGANLRSY